MKFSKKEIIQLIIHELDELQEEKPFTEDKDYDRGQYDALLYVLEDLLDTDY